MESPRFTGAFEQVAALHGLLVRQVRVSKASEADRVITLAIAALLHGVLERSGFFSSARYLSRELRRELEAEHRSLHEAADLMAELAETDRDAEDLRTLCDAVREKIARHTQRDERLFYGSLAALDAARPRQDG